MSETKWTKGPWSLGDKCKHTHGREVLHDNNEPGSISMVLARAYARPCWEAEGEANARLIAASPELYEALANVVAEYDEEDNGRTLRWAVDSARDVLAKARGE